MDHAAEDTRPLSAVRSLKNFGHGIEVQQADGLGAIDRDLEVAWANDGTEVKERARNAGDRDAVSHGDVLGLKGARMMHPEPVHSMAAACDRHVHPGAARPHAHRSAADLWLSTAPLPTAITAARYAPDFDSRLSPIAYTRPPCSWCKLPARTRLRIANLSNPSWASCVRAMTPCCLPASRAIACPRVRGRESLRFRYQSLPPREGGGLGVAGGLRVLSPGYENVATGCGPGLGYTRNGMISRATMFATLIIGLMAGPAVSL